MSNVATNPVGVGFAFPLSFVDGRVKLTSQSRVTVSSDAGITGSVASNISVLASTALEQQAVIKQAVRRILETPQGTRFMAGEIGSLLDLVPFEVNDEQLHQLALAYAAQAIGSQEARVEILELQASQDSEHGERVNALMTYRIRRTQITDTSVIFERSE